MLTAALLAAGAFTVLGQTVTHPFVARADDQTTSITSIETTNNATVITFGTTAATDGAWVQLNKEIYLQTDVGNAHYGYIKSENIPLVPGRYNLKKAGDRLAFKIYFQKIPARAKTLDIIERAGTSNEATYFNYYGVKLNSSGPKIVDVVLSPPPSPAKTMVDTAYNVGPEVAGLGSMAAYMLNSQLKFYSQPGKLAEIARLNKQYYDELVKAGFSADQATKMVSGINFMKGLGNN